MAVNCPQCQAAIDVDEDELDEGDPLTCEECGASIIVTSSHPLELEVEDEDDEDEDYDEDEDDEFDDEDEEEDEEDDKWE